MKHTTPTVIACAAAALLSLTLASSALAQQVADPTTGEIVALSEIDFTSLTKSEVRDIASQLRAQGLSRREARQAVRSEIQSDLGATFAGVEVTDPETGNIVPVDALDFSALSREERRAVIADLTDQGYGQRQARGFVAGETRTDIGAVEVTDPITGETVPVSEIDRRSLTREQRQDIGQQLADAGVERANENRGDRGPRGDRADRGNGPGQE